MQHGGPHAKGVGGAEPGAERLSMKIRRLRVLGVAMALSAVAALFGVVFYLLPRNVATSANRLADFVVLNEA